MDLALDVGGKGNLVPLPEVGTTPAFQIPIQWDLTMHWEGWEKKKRFIQLYQGCVVLSSARKESPSARGDIPK